MSEQPMQEQQMSAQPAPGLPGDRCYIAVVGPSTASDDQCRLAEEVGRRLAEAGAVVVCGGLGGVMEAVSRGAAAAGGTVVGILPGADRRAANPHLTVALATGLDEMRNPLIVRVTDAVLAVGGAYGTLSEVAFALRVGRPVVGLATWDLPDVVAVHGAPEAVDLVLALAGAEPGR